MFPVTTTTTTTTIIIIIFSLLIKKNMLLEYGREMSLLCSLSSFFFFFFLFLSWRCALIWLLGEKKVIHLFQPALYIACVNLEVLEAVLEDYSV